MHGRTIHYQLCRLCLTVRVSLTLFAFVIFFVWANGPGHVDIHLRRPFCSRLGVLRPSCVFVCVVCVKTLMHQQKPSVCMDPIACLP